MFVSRVQLRNGDILDLGDEMKGAVSDALKKAAQHFGVGLYLARSEESMHLEYAEEQAVSPISSEHFDRLGELSRLLFWGSYWLFSDVL